MRIFVKAKSKAKEARVEKIDETHFVVFVKEPPIEGRANSAVIRALADYFQLARPRVKIVSGHTARQKIIEVGPMGEDKE